MKNLAIFLLVCMLSLSVEAQRTPKQSVSTPIPTQNLNDWFAPVKWRSIGPFRGGRSVGSSGVAGDPLTYYMGTTGGGLWKTSDGGQNWKNVSDGYFKTGSVGMVSVSESDPLVVYVGMGEHAPRGVMSSYGDGVYKSSDAGKTWEHMGLEASRHIANIAIHPANPDIVYVAAQGAMHGPSDERGIYKSTDGGRTWKNVLFVNNTTGCASLSMDMNNPRILYAAMWDHIRYPWQMVSGGPGSGLYKSTDSGETWKKIQDGLPEGLGKMSVSVSRDNSERVYALVESDTEKEQGGLFVSADGGNKWTRVSKDHNLLQRAWYYIEVAADPQDEHTVYVLNAATWKSIDGGKNWTRIGGTHGDYHDLWINPANNQNMVISNDGGAAVTFNGGASWTGQDFATAQFYRLNADNHWPYRIYAGQQDNSSVIMDSRNPTGGGLTDRHFGYSAGGESAFLAFDPNDPRYVLGGSYQGAINAFDAHTGIGTSAMAAPIQYLAMEPKDMKYRFNWNAPIIWSQHETQTFYHGAQVVLKTTDRGISWTEISPDLTRNNPSQQGKGGIPYTNEGAGGENYGTLSYLTESPHEKGVIWTGSDDGLVYLTRDNGQNWINVTPKGLKECLINAIEVSPHHPAVAYLATTRYKFNDFTPGLYKTTDYGATWINISAGIPMGAYTRVVREDPIRKDLLFAGTETGIYLSYDGGRHWLPFRLNLPVVPITDLMVWHDDLIAATQGRSFWILDDLPLLRQYKDGQKVTGLYQPEDVYRVEARSELDANNPDFTGAALSHGVNPATGTVFYYTLPSLPDSAVISLSITDPDGQPVRAFSSQADPGFTLYPGGPSPDPVLTKTAGLNRFVWDLRYPSLLGAPSAYMEGSFDGHLARPGTYTARLSVGSASQETRFQILPFPHLEGTPEDYMEQHLTMVRIATTVNTIHGAVNQLQEAKKQLNALSARLTGDYPELHQMGRALDERIMAWDARLIQRKNQSYDDVINFVNGLTAYYLFVKGNLDSTSPRVTRGEIEQLDALDLKWESLQSEQKAIIADINAFNAACQKAGIQAIQYE
ncbi:MAG: glycosyl hydrolase [Cyclobacteriaceae bacterium]|nr:glycosyl hydrolase [Cyclobacteriaceae bacterium]